MKTKLLFSIAVSLLVLASMSAAAQDIDLTDFSLSRHDFVDTVKVEIVKGAVIVPVEIEGETKRMMFDTGAEFGFWIAGNEAWMQPSGDNITITDSQNTCHKIPIYRVPSMTIGSTTIEGYPIIAQEEMNEVVCGRFEGGLGFNLVAKGLSFKLDTKDSLLIMTDRKRFFAKEEKGQPTLKYREDDVPRVMVGFPFTRVKMLFDTGWLGGWFDFPEYWLNRWSKDDKKMRETVDGLTVQRDTSVVAQSGFFGRSSDTVTYRTLLLPTVKFDDLTFKDVWMSTDSHSTKTGSALLKRNSLIIDAQKKRLVLLPHDGNLEQVVKNEGDGISFITASEDDSLGAVQAVVQKGSKAYRKGIRTGDYLVTANGAPITDMCTYVRLSNKEKVTRMVFRTPEGLEKEIDWLNGDIFSLTKKGAHYVFNASINGKADATILLESGIPALLVDSAYVFNSGILSDMELTVTDKEKLNLAGRVYKLTHKANGTVRIGNNTSYTGEVFVLANYDYGPYEAAVPVMYLHNDLDKGSRIVNLDLGNQSLRMLNRASLNDKKKTYSEGKMNTATYMGLPAIETSVTLDDGVKTRTLSGNFMIDFGNPELLFLLDQPEEVQKFLSDNADMELRDATAPNGEVVGQFILTKQCQLFGITFPDAVVVITKNLPSFTAPGNIGLKFFERTDAVFDFDQSVVYMKGK